MLLSMLLVIALVGVWLARANLPPIVFRTLLVIIALVAVITTLARFAPNRGPELVAVFDQACGHQAGLWIRDHVAIPGEVLFIDSSPTSETGKAIQRARIKGLHKALSQDGWSIEERILTREESMDSLGGQFVPVSIVAAAHATTGPYTAVVLGEGLPVLGSEQHPGDLPPILSLSDPDPDTREESLKRGLLAGAVVSRSNADRGAEPSRRMALEDVFALRYELVQSSRITR